MRIPCPFCGERDLEEFSVLGEVPAAARPDTGDADALAQFHAYVHLRDNVAGVHREHWYHAAGCRRWLVVTRDAKSHALTLVEFAAP